jgi:acyl-coenzyme A synthetase/AMP-(fatty) acid ligase
MNPLSEALRRHATDRPDRLAVAVGEAALTYAELAAAVAARAASHRADDGGWSLVTVDRGVAGVVAVLAAIDAGARPVLVDPDSSAAERAAVRRVVAAESAAPARPAYALVTSGTTGRAKVIARDLAATLANTQAFVAQVGYAPDDRVLGLTPLHHAYGLTAALFGPMLTGCGLVLPDGAPTGRVVLATMNRAPCTVTLGVPFLYQSTVDAARSARHLGPRVSVCAGDRMPAGLSEDWRRTFGVWLTNHYGSTEGGFITVAEPGDLDTVGRPVPGVELRTGTVDGRGRGELMVRLPAGFQRRLGAGLLDGEGGAGWLATGDLADIDASGRVRLHGRLGLSVTLAGRQVDLVEVEHAVRAHPAVVDCRVVAAPFPDGPRLHAFVAGAPELTELDLRRYLATVLSTYKVPSRITIGDLPRTATGKVRMAALREAAEGPR